MLKSIDEKGMSATGEAADLSPADGAGGYRDVMESVTALTVTIQVRR